MTSSRFPKKPYPGSPEAKEAGCRCPVFDNEYGKGRYGNGARYGWFVVMSCPLHGELNLAPLPPGKPELQLHKGGCEPCKALFRRMPPRLRLIRGGKS